MITIKLFLVITVLSITPTYQYCGCGPNRAYNITQNKCLKYPKQGEEGYEQGCKRYTILESQSQDWQCSSCETSYFRAAGPRCVKTDLEGCTNVQKKSSTQLSQVQINQRFLANSDTYTCNQCDTSQYYLKDGKCLKKPIEGEDGYIENCQVYKYWNNNNNEKIYCQYCESGYYKGIDNQCQKNPSYPNKCTSFQVTRGGTPWCQICQDGYIAVSGNKCESKDTVIANCGQYYSDISSHNIKNFCSGCKKGYYPNVNSTQCEANPKKGQDNYVKNCAQYEYPYSSQELKCKYCDMDLIYDSGKNQCVKVKQSIKECKKYEYENENSKEENCYLCMENYSLIRNKDKMNQCIKCPNTPDNNGSGDILKISLLLILTTLFIII